MRFHPVGNNMDAFRSHTRQLNDPFLRKLRDSDYCADFTDKARQQRVVPERELALKPFGMIKSRSIMNGQHLPAHAERSRIPRAPQEPVLQLSRKIKLFPEGSLDSL